MITIQEQINHYTIDPVTNCWNWNGATTNEGYGRMKINKKCYGVHRISYQI